MTNRRNFFVTVLAVVAAKPARPKPVIDRKHITTGTLGTIDADKITSLDRNKIAQGVITADRIKYI